MIYRKPKSLRSKMLELPVGESIILKPSMSVENTARNYASVIKGYTGREFIVHRAADHIEIGRVR